ncbi:MAG: DUF1254 domain-containing protein [Rhizobium sp.]
MRKILFAVVIGLIGAALLHLIIILALPRFSDRDAFQRVDMLGDEDTFHLLDGSKEGGGLLNGDPYLSTAVCAFDLADMPVHLTAGGRVPFWSLAIYDKASNEVFSMSDRTSVGGALDVLVASPVQLTGIRKMLPAALSQSILVEMPEGQGYAVLRTMAPQASFEDGGHAFLAAAQCDAFDAGSAAD